MEDIHFIVKEFGILGMLLAIPLFSVLYMLVRRFVNRRLRKKGLPTDREAYAVSFSVSHYKAHGEGAPPSSATDGESTQNTTNEDKEETKE